MKILFLDLLYWQIVEKIDYCHKSVIDTSQDIDFGIGKPLAESFKNIDIEAHHFYLNLLNHNKNIFNQKSKYSAYLFKLLSIQNNKIKSLIKLLIYIRGLFIAYKFCQKEKPDVIWLFSLRHLPPFIVKKFKVHSKILVGHISSHLPKEKWLNSYDLLLSSHPEFVRNWKIAGKHSYLFKTGVNAKLLQVAPFSDRKITLSFVGSLTKDHLKRLKYLEEISQIFDIEIYSPSKPPESDYPNIAEKWKGPAWGENYFRTLSQSKMTLNIHIDMASSNAANVRLAEATGLGCLLFTEKTDNRHDYFSDDEVIYYKDLKDLIHKISFFMVNQDLAQAIALNGFEKTKAFHTYDYRASELLPVLRAHLKNIKL